MSIQVKPNVMNDSSGMKYPISNLFFKRVRVCMIMGGTYPGFQKEKRVYSILMVYVGVFWIVWTGSVISFIATIYIYITKSKDITRLVTYFLTILAAFYPSVINSFFVPKTLKAFEELFIKYEEKHSLHPCFKKWTKRLKVIIVIIPFFILLGTIFPVMTSINNGRLNCINFPSCEFPEPWRTVSQTNSLIAFTMAYFLLQTTFIVFNVVAYILLKEFGRVSTRFQKISTIDQDKQEEEFKASAAQYEDLADLLNTASDFTQHFSLALLFLSLPLACSYMYAALVQEATYSDITEMAFGAFYTCIFICVWLLTEANVSLKAKEPLQYVWKLKTDEFTDKGMQNVQMLVSRLTGDSPGYSVYGLVTINMPTVLSVVSTIAAYAIIVVQFRAPSSPSCPALLNSSQLIEL